MRINFIGADHEVTGSCHYIEVGDKVILLDYGMEQGPNIYENVNIPVDYSEIDYIFLSHAHIDHSGMIPHLYQKGFRGQIYATRATCDLCNVMLLDSAHIQEFEASWRNRKSKRSGEEEYVPLYTCEEAQATCELFVPCKYNEIIKVCDEVSIRFTDVGHLLGSAAIEIFMTEGDLSKTLVFSGDIGNINQPIINDPQYIDSADYLIIESTYGNRLHGEVPDYVNSFARIIQETLDKGGNLVIPSFAVGRTQEILYFIREIKEKGLVKNHDGFEVYIDSPLAIESTTIFGKNGRDCFDEDAIKLLDEGKNPFVFDGLKVATSTQDSININEITTPKVIISASGMCEAGRIKHHLKHNLWRRDSTILFVGYQAVGTLGRKILDGAETVKLFGETIQVNARIEKIAGISGHADKIGLLNWINHIKNKPSKIFVVHGEDMVCDEFARSIKQEFGIDAYAPYSGGEFNISENEKVTIGTGVRIKQKGANVISDIYKALLDALDRLKRIVANSQQIDNKSIKQLTSEIDTICDKWE